MAHVYVIREKWLINRPELQAQLSDAQHYFAGIIERLSVLSDMEREIEFERFE